MRFLGTWSSTTQSEERVNIPATSPLVSELVHHLLGEDLAPHEELLGQLVLQLQFWLGHLRRSLVQHFMQ